MENRSILIVDDEKNIRLTLSQALQPIGLRVDTAVNGEDALEKINKEEFNLVLLDFKMPGMDGLEVLRRLKEMRPRMQVIIITAFGSIESAVEAMKIGAVDFIQKPFSPDEIRELVSRVLTRERLDPQEAEDYDSHLELAKKSISDRHFDEALKHIHKAIAIDPTRAEAFNLLGALLEIKGDRLNAIKNYRAALSLDPTYEPAGKNLDRSTKWPYKGGVLFDGSGHNKK
jgi:DNA-binding NtrC family response regulator